MPLNETKRNVLRLEGVQGLPVLQANVAGIDLGSEEHWVCAPNPEGTGREVSRFGATTPELHRLAEWLKERNVESVAMESTGVYWIAPYELLEAEGFEVQLVDTRELTRVPGRKKTDRIDSKWIQQLHSCGLLNAAFRPDEATCMLRTLVRQKAVLVAEAGDWLRRMQKSLDEMNVRVHRAVSDLQGTTGMAIIHAIVAGERDARKLAQLRDVRCRKDEDEIAEQLTGHWREDHLFALKQSLQMYEAIQQRIADYEAEIVRRLDHMTPAGRTGESAPKLTNANKAKAIKRRGEEETRQALYRMSGADLTAIDAIGVESAQVILSEYGPDLSRFPTEHQFVSHLRLAPNKPMSAGKVIKKRRPQSPTARGAAVLRMAATCLDRSQTALGANFRNYARRLGHDVAIFVMARKLAILIYRQLRWGQPYIDAGVEAAEKRYQEARVRRLATNAKQLGYVLTPMAIPA